MKKKHLLASAGILLTMALAGCTGSASTDEPGENADDGSLEKTEIAVGVLPLADYAAVYWAVDNGFFDEVGLDVELQPLQGGPIGVQKVVSGELDFSFANSISTTIAIDGGAPVTNVVASSSLGDHSNLIFVLEDSEVQEMADLDGKSIGTNTTNNIGDVTFKNLASSLDIDVTPDWVEVPFNEMVAGVEAGSIDAGYVPEPFASAAFAAGLREVVDLTEGPNKELTAASFVTSDAYVAENPNTVAAFVDAMYAAGNDISQKEEEFRAWLPEVAGVSEEVANNMALPVFESEMKLENLQDIADMLYEQEIIDELDMTEHTFVQ